MNHHKDRKVGVTVGRKGIKNVEVKGNENNFIWYSFRPNDRKVNFKCQFQIERHKIKITKQKLRIASQCHPRPEPQQQ